MKDESVFKTNTVYDWLWGFEELDLKNLSENTLGLVGDNLGLNSEFGMMQSLKPGTILSETEIYQGMNSEKSPTWNRQLQLASLAGKNDISCWENADLDSFENATEGLGVGPMFLKNSDKMQVYRSEFLHKVYYEKTKRKLKYFGWLDLKVMKPEVEEFNRFCLHANRSGADYCGKEVYEVGKCKGVSVPLGYSWPYFLNAEEKFKKGFDVFKNGEKVVGSDEEHGSRLSIEPTTGITCK